MSLLYFPISITLMFVLLPSSQQVQCTPCFTTTSLPAAISLHPRRLPRYSLLPSAPPCFHLLLPSSLSIVESLVGGVNLVLGSVASSLNAWLLLDCWGFPLGCVGVWPLWFMSWTLTCKHGISPEKYHSH